MTPALDRTQPTMCRRTFISTFDHVPGSRSTRASDEVPGSFRVDDHGSQHGAIGEYLAHYHGERNHQGLDNVLLKGAPAPANENGRVLRRERLGGLLNYYHRNAA